jgi:hypothetical protein
VGKLPGYRLGDCPKAPICDVAVYLSSLRLTVEDLGIQEFRDLGIAPNNVIKVWDIWISTL